LDREKITERLKKIKELAERGVGGEKETAMRMYEELKAKYEIEDAEIMEDKLEKHWFSYSTEFEEKLLTRIFYMITGSGECYQYTGKYSRRKQRGCMCTMLEAAEIQTYFNHYKILLEDELETFWIAFIFGQQLFPNESARLYKEPEEDIKEISEEDKRRRKKAAFMAFGMETRKPQRLLEEME
jgi:hypothetical protein